MFTIDNYEYDCTKKCKCREHGHRINSAITKRSIPDDKLAAFVAKTCKNFAEVLDFEGRSALHLASSVDRYSLVEWLLNHGALINGKDEESGNSSLHRAIFYGCIDCAVLLMRYGANLEITDDDFRNPLQYVCKPGDLEYYREIALNNELLVWGINKNNNLGVGNEQGSVTPQSIDIFRKGNISIKSLSMSAYHSYFLDNNGHVYAVGHGKGGRLGIGTENSLIVPKLLKLPKKDADERAICVSCSRNHSLILTNKNTVLTCGLNTDQQLGIKSAPEVLPALKEITSFSQFGIIGLVGVIARDHHSIAYNAHEVYVWGANHGQFGLKSDISHVALPRGLQLPDKKLEIVESNNSAIVCYTACKLIILYYNYKVKSIKTPSLEPLACISVSGGGREKAGDTLKILVLTSTNWVYIWYEDLSQYIRCTYLMTRYLEVDKIILKSNQLLILSRGDLYTGKATKIAIHNPLDIGEYKDTYNKKEICSKSRIKIDLKRIPNIDRAVDIFCDDDFESFAVLQESARKYYEMPRLVPEENTFKTLLHEVSEFDAVHDIIFHVDNEIFPAHKFIVFSRSKGLMKAVGNLQDKDIYLNYQGLTGKMFEIILKHIYTNYFVSEEDLDEIMQSIGPGFSGDRVDVCNIFLEFINKFELFDLAHSIKSLSEGVTMRQKSKFPRLRRTALPELHDVKILCADNKELNAHKCVLVARLEYFNLMFNNSWVETKEANLSTVPLEYMNPLIDFLYSADVNAFKKEERSENFLYNMIVICDQFFVINLRRVCEALVLERISVRKCGEMLEFACAYNCDILEKGCLEFISQNLSRCLEQHSLESCEHQVLERINGFYRQVYKKTLDFRVITPSSDAITDDALTDFVVDFSIDLKHRMTDGDLKSKAKTKVKANKTVISKRNYEKEAISSMKAHSEVPTEIKQSEIKAEAEKVAQKIQAESSTWMKVQDTKKKPVTANAIKTNEILRAESKPKEQFISLNQLIKSVEKTPPKVSQTEPQETANRPNFHLGDFTPLKGEKLSQKQRKARLSSESKSNETTPTSHPIPIPQKPNPWGTPTSPSSYEPSSSFADIMKSPDSLPKQQYSTSPMKTPPSSRKQLNKSPPKSFTSASTSSPVTSGAAGTSSTTPRSTSANFSKILQDERKQKEYFEKMKSKSLILTQIEETAIDELKTFYNVDNVYDEWITVERKQVEATMNFAVWQRN